MKLNDFLKKQREIAAQHGKGEPEIERIYNQLIEGLKERIADSPFQTMFGFSVVLEPGLGYEPEYLQRELMRLAVKNGEEIKITIDFDDKQRCFITGKCEG
ncbi:hypothetical protein OHW42_11305 [Acinetobacter baumannii]|nr:hypothetical protein [Acinetobacter baumannii]MDC5154556.1 hypothetical protein [Acinetobacter baumannii]